MPCESIALAAARSCGALTAAAADLFQDYELTPEQGDEIVNFMHDNKERLREMSLRMALKIADLRKISPNWKALAESTCMKHDLG